MKYQTFLDELRKIGFIVPDPPPKPTKAKEQRQSYYDRSIPECGISLMSSAKYQWDDAKPWEDEPALVLRWEIGGTTGGSCWDRGDEPTQYRSRSGEPEPEWIQLDEILTHFCPNITHLRYKGVIRLGTFEERTENEYYGNSTTYGLRFIKLKALCKHLTTNKLFEGEFAEVEPVEDDTVAPVVETVDLSAPPIKKRKR